MANNSTLTPGSQKQGEDNIGQRKTDQLVNNLSHAEQQPGTTNMDDFERNYGENADSAQEDANIDKVREQESAGAPRNQWAVDVSPNKGNEGSSKVKNFWEYIVKHKKGVAIGGGAGGGIIALMIFFSGMLSLPGIGEMIMSDDASSRAIQARVLKVFNGAVSDTSTACQGTKIKTFGCMTRRISHTALASLEKAGITAYDSDGNKIEIKASGYPEKNPATYKIETTNLDGTIHTKSSSELADFISDNKALKGKIFGTGGLFNPTYKNWASKYITERVLKPGGVNKTGGLADGENKKTTPNERAAAFKEKLSKVLPSFAKAGGGATAQSVADRISEKTGAKVEKQLSRAKKGGVGYLTSVGTCVGVKLPMYFAAGYAAVQIAQILPVINEVILSPMSKQKASGGDPTVEFSGDDMDFIMSTMTEKYPDENGDMKSALESPILQSAMGINSGKPDISEEYAPGYAAIATPLVIASVATSAAMEPACNAIMSPASMYSAMAVDAATTVAASATVVGGVIKVVASWAISEVAVKAAAALAGAAAGALVTQLATNEDIPGAKGKDLGDLLGTSAYVLKGSVDAARGLNVIKEADIPAINEQTAQLNAEMREMDIASLSPFDTSSRYTFLGSITSNFSASLISNSGYGSNILGGLAAVAKMPFVSSVGAAPTQSYAAEFNLTTDGGGTPCITVAGTPCYELTPQQAAMSTSAASDALYSEGWIDDSKDITKDDATITDLVAGGQIKEDTPLYDHITTCGDLLSGDYIINAGACTTTTTTKSAAGVGGALNGACVDEEESSCAGTSTDTVEGVKDATSLVAMAPALIDYQIIQSFNGNDEPEQTGGSSTIATGTYMLPVDQGYGVPDPGQDWGDRECNGCTTFHRGVDLTNFPSGSKGKPVYSVTSGTVIQATKSNGSGSSCQGGMGDAPYSTNNPVHIQHADGTIGVYLHMGPGDITVNEGDTVTAGQQIGAINNCGQSFGAHLHFAIQLGSATDPKITGLDQNANGAMFLNPQAYMALYGIDIMKGTYTDGR